MIPRAKVLVFLVVLRESEGDFLRPDMENYTFFSKIT